MDGRYAWLGHGKNLPSGKSGFENPINLASAVCTCNNAMHVLVFFLPKEGSLKYSQGKREIARSVAMDGGNLQKFPRRR